MTPFITKTTKLSGVSEIRTSLCPDFGIVGILEVRFSDVDCISVDRNSLECANRAISILCMPYYNLYWLS